MILLDIFFSNFKWYRRRRGGTWYLLYNDERAGGIEGPDWHWRQYELEGWEVLKTEKY